MGERIGVVKLAAFGPRSLEMRNTIFGERGGNEITVAEGNERSYILVRIPENVIRYLVQIVQEAVHSQLTVVQHG